jgi:PhnB protein
MTSYDHSLRPQGAMAITPYLTIANAVATIEFLKKAFNAIELSVMKLTDGKIRHAELMIDDSMIMLSDATEKYPPMPGMYYLYVADVDTAYQTALDAGAISLTPPTDQPYGDRTAGVKDPGDNQWWLASPSKTTTKN